MRLPRLAMLIAASLVGLASSAMAQTPPPPAPPAAQAPQPKPGDAFGEEVMLTAKTIVYARGSATWDSAFDTLVEAFKNVYGALQKQCLKADGPAMTIYTATDDTGFEYQAGVPVAEAPKTPLPEGFAVGKSPEGRALKFIHRGSYDAMDSTYEAITNYLDDKGIDAKDNFIEEYTGGPLNPGDNDMLVNVFVPIK